MTDEVKNEKIEEQINDDAVQEQLVEDALQDEEALEPEAVVDEDESVDVVDDDVSDEIEDEGASDDIEEADFDEEEVLEEEESVQAEQADGESGSIEDADESDEAEDQEQSEDVKEEEASDDDEAVNGDLESEDDSDAEVSEEAGSENKEQKVFGVVEEGVEPTVESVIEAILFAIDEPITPNRLVGIVEVGGVKEIKEAVEKLNDKYRQMNSAFRVEEIAGGLQMMTLSNYNHWLKKMIKVRSDSKLTQAAMETLAIIAYKQPIIRADVEAIRGVGSGEMIRSLMYKGLVKISGRAEVLGRPLMYGTTKKFLEAFGLGNLKDLPKIEEFKKPE